MPQMVTIFDPQGNKGEVPFEQYHAALQAGAKPAVTVKSPSGQIGEIPYERLGDALKAGAQWIPLEEQGNQHPGFWSTLGSDLVGMAKSAANPQTILENAATGGIPIASTLRSLAQIPAENQRRKSEGRSAAYRIAAPIAEMTTGVNARGMEESANEGDRGGVLGHAAAPLVTTAATLGASEVAPKIADISPTKATAPVRAAVRGANKALAKAPGTIGGSAGALIGAKLAGRLGAEIGGAAGAMAGKELLPQVQLPWENVGLPKRVEGGPKVAPQYEAPATPDFLQAKVYRARSAGEQGVPYNPKSHAQATASLDQAKTYAEPGQRDAITGKPQEVVGVDLSQTPGFSVVQNGGNPPWVKFHGEVPETAINTEVAAPDFLNTKKTVNKIGDQIEQGLGGRPLEPNVPLRQQGKAPASNLPQGFNAHESTALNGSKYNPAAKEFEVVNSSGHYIYGDVSPEAAQKFAEAESKGQAWGEIKRKHPLVGKVVNGKRVSVNPARK